jgi:uncharacterized protein YjbI with pentapeptide repeats
MCIRLINKKPSTNLTSPTITVPASGTVVLLENGEHDVREYAKAKVEVKQPEGTIEITENGTHNIADYAEANVNVVPDNVVDYWSTEPSNKTNGNFNLLYYAKELPKNINISNWASSIDITYLNLLEKADFREWDFSNTTHFYFNGNKNLKEVDMSNCELPKVSSFANFCSSCTSLEKMTLKGLKLPSTITSLSSMCYYCQKLKRADLSGLMLSNINNIYHFFRDCSSLEYLDIRDLDLLNATSYSNAFKSVPTNCEIIVKDNANREWILQKCNSKLTNIKTVAEIEGV